MDTRDSIKTLSDQDMDEVLGGAAGLGGWGTKWNSAASSPAEFDSATGSAEGLLGEAPQNIDKGADSVA